MRNIYDNNIKVAMQEKASIDELTEQMFMNLRVADTPSKMALDLAK